MPIVALCLVILILMGMCGIFYPKLYKIYNKLKKHFSQEEETLECDCAECQGSHILDDDYEGYKEYEYEDEDECGDEYDLRHSNIKNKEIRE